VENLGELFVFFRRREGGQNFSPLVERHGLHDRDDVIHRLIGRRRGILQHRHDLIFGLLGRNRLQRPLQFEQRGIGRGRLQLGDPLIDLGILLAYWTPMEGPGQTDALTAVTGREGYMNREQLIDRYAEVSGRDLSDIAYFEAFALFKIAVVIQQIYYRFRRGQTDDPRFAGLGERVVALAARAEQLANQK